MISSASTLLLLVGIYAALFGVMSYVHRVTSSTSVRISFMNFEFDPFCFYVFTKNKIQELLIPLVGIYAAPFGTVVGVRSTPPSHA